MVDTHMDLHHLRKWSAIRVQNLYQSLGAVKHNTIMFDQEDSGAGWVTTGPA